MNSHSKEQALRGRVLAHRILEAARVVEESTREPQDIVTTRAMGQMIRDGAQLFGQAVMTIERMRLAKSVDQVRHIANAFLADLGR